MMISFENFASDQPGLSPSSRRNTISSAYSTRVAPTTSSLERLCNLLVVPALEYPINRIGEEISLFVEILDLPRVNIALSFQPSQVLPSGGEVNRSWLHLPNFPSSCLPLFLPFVPSLFPTFFNEKTL